MDYPRRWALTRDSGPIPAYLHISIIMDPHEQAQKTWHEDGDRKLTRAGWHLPKNTSAGVDLKLGRTDSGNGSFKPWLEKTTSSVFYSFLTSSSDSWPLTSWKCHHPHGTASLWWVIADKSFYTAENYCDSGMNQTVQNEGFAMNLVKWYCTSTEGVVH